MAQVVFDTLPLEQDGFAIERKLFDKQASAALIGAIEKDVSVDSGRGGIRNLLDRPLFQKLAESAQLMRLVAAILGADAFVVRGILFDKNDSANWKVPWHQDVTVAVTNKSEVEGYGPWSVKAGVVHVQPPACVLERMISIRIHLDDCAAENGALRVLPGTHCNGKLSQRITDEYVAKLKPVVCEAQAGDVLIMRPLLLHSSSTATVPRHRRVLHFHYANVELADGLRWRERRSNSEMRGSLHCAVR